MPKTVLLASQRPSDYVEMKRCALALAARGHTIQFIYHPIYGGQELDLPLLEDMRALEQSGKLSRIRVVEERVRSKRMKPPKTEVAPKQLGWFKRQVARLRRPVLTALDRVLAIIKRPIAAAYLAWLYPQRLREYDTILKDFRPDIIILPEDVVGLVTPLLIKAGHRNDIPSLILPYTIANQQEAFQSLRHYPSLDGWRWHNLWVVLCLRNWVMRQDGRTVIRLPVAHIIGHLLSGASPPDPWMMNSGYANAIAVENQSMYDYYLSAGIPASKMRVVGAVYDDTLAQFRLSKPAALTTLRNEIGIDNDKPLLLIGGCPDQTGSCPGFEFADMKDFAARLAAAMIPLAADYQVVVRPHPNYPELGDMLRTHGFFITDTDTARLVALSDGYIAFASATIRWAVSCGIPTINYDVFQYDYSDFKNTRSVCNVANYTDFLRALASLRLDGPELSSLRAMARAEAPRWGNLDGNSVTRIEALMGELCAVKPVRRTAV